MSLCLVLAGCGSGRKASSELAKPIYPSCSFKNFAPPSATAIPGPNGGKAWQVAYRPIPLSPYRPEETSVVMLVEQSPSLPQVGIRLGHTVTVAGHKVSLRYPGAGGARVFGAQWNTSRARYIALANGTRPDTLERFISCLP